jgi:molybdopterin-guanine dinucleotide biosynthesis protein A
MACASWARGISTSAPVAGLLTARARNADAHWLVLACDYPLVTVEALRPLREEFEEPVTCFANRDGFVKPLCRLGARGVGEVEGEVRACSHPRGNKTYSQR